jgi:hypothetical protein
MAGLDPVGYAVPPFLNRAQALRIAKLGNRAVAGVALQRVFCHESGAFRHLRWPSQLHEFCSNVNHLTPLDGSPS